MQQVLGPRDMSRTLTRLGVFCAASIALHALTLVTYKPFGVAAAGDTGSAMVLHATLDRAAPFLSPSSGAESTAASSEMLPAASHIEIDQPARAGASDGLNLPLPDKWFAAHEVDVRAEPLSSVNIDYPEELAGSGITGRVQVVILIDERGRVRKVEVARAVPEGVFDKAAVRAWNDVRFSPAMKAGAPVKSQKIVELAYSAF